jgi:glycosyltransferase involved in cell wall biosynthesis
MRILMLAPRLPHAQSHSGMQIVYQRMHRLLERGHQVGLACFVDREHDLPYLEMVETGLLDMQVLEDPFLNRFLPNSIISGRYSSPSSFFRYHSGRMKRMIGEMILASGYNVAIAEFSAMGQCFYRNPYLPAVRRIISCHDSPTLGSRRRIDMLNASLNWGRQWLEYRHMRHMEFQLYRAADRVITLTNEERLDLLEEEPSLGITAVSPGISSSAYGPIQDLPKEHCITITGRFSSDQSHYGALWFLRNVWPLIRRRDPAVKLYMVGRDPSSAMLHVAKRDPRVIVTGAVQDLRPFLAKTKVYVCPVLSGSGIRGKILEAFSMNLPVVTTSVAAEGIPIDQGSNAFIADAPEVMADFVQMLLHDPEKAEIMGRRARNAVETHFNWDKSIDLLEKVLVESVSKRSFHNVS